MRLQLRHIKAIRTYYKFIALFFLHGTSLCLNAQNEFSKWYFGSYAGLDFSTQPPTSLNSSTLYAVEGCASISDGSGNLLFYTEGSTIYNATHTVLANGTGLLGHPSSAQSANAIQQPGSGNIYYLFTIPGIYTGTNTPAAYSIVDMNLAAGMGSVTVKNATLYAPTCESQVLVRHCNGKDVWAISHEFNSNKFRAYLLGPTGLNPIPVISSIGEPITNTSATAGQLKISPNGRKLAMATASNSPGNPKEKGFFLFDFDPSSGVVSNSLSLLSGTNIPNNIPYGVEFSTDGTKLYGSTWYTNSALYQWDICAPTNSAIVSSQYSLAIPMIGTIQRAIDGKIYLTNVAQPQLHVINNPNSLGTAMNFSTNAINITPKYCNLGLPNYINPYIKPTFTSFINNITCQKVNFSPPPIPTFSIGCIPTSYSVSNYLWDFGDPASGAANSSTLTNPVHTYSLMGTYTVSLILYSNCTNDTLKKVVTISTPGPTLSVNGTSLICKGAKTVYTVSGGSTYQWSNNTIATTATFSPANTTVYSVTATLNGCSASRLFTVTVDPCTGIASFENNDRLHIFPNPVKDLLTVEAKEAANVLLFDINGTLVLERKVEPGMNELNTSSLRPGIYMIQANDENGVWLGRLVKME